MRAFAYGIKPLLDPRMNLPIRISQNLAGDVGNQLVIAQQIREADLGTMRGSGVRGFMHGNSPQQKAAVYTSSLIFAAGACFHAVRLIAVMEIIVGVLVVAMLAARMVVAARRA